MMIIDCPVKIQQNEEEFSWLFEKLQALKPLKIIEIGTLEGGTLWNWINLEPKKIVSIDNNPSTVEMVNELKKNCVGWIKGKDIEVTFICGRSQDQEVVEMVRDIIGEADFVFIDGDHTEIGAEKDFHKYWSLLRSGGMMALHDIHREESPYGVWKVWKEIKSLGYNTEEFIYNEKTMGTGIVYKA